MSFIRRLLVHQIVIIQAIIALLDISKSYTPFNNNLYTYFDKCGLKEGGEWFISTFSFSMFIGLNVIELVFALLAVFGCKLFGRINSALVLFHGIILLDIFSTGLSNDLFVLLAVVFAILVSSIPYQNYVIDEGKETKHQKHQKQE